MCSSILFSNSVSILITNALNFLSCKLFISVFLIFFQEFSLVLWIETNSLILIWLTFSETMKLGETVTFCCLERVCLCEHIPIQSPCAQWLWWERWTWHENKSHLSSGFAGSYPLGSRWSCRWRGYGQNQVWAEASTLISYHHCPIGGMVGSQVTGAEALRVRSGLAKFPLIVCFPTLPAPAL